MGCAALACGFASQENSRSVKKKARAILWSCICRPLARRGKGATGKSLESCSGEICVEQVELWIQRQRALQIAFCLRRITSFLVDHAGVEEQLWILCPLLQGVRDRFGRLLNFVTLEQGPREHVPGVNVTPDFQLVLSQCQGLMQFQAVVGIEKCQVAIMDLLIDLAEIANELDQFILLLCFVELSEFAINVAKGCGIFRIRHFRDGFFVESDRVAVSALRGADLSEPGKRAIVVGILLER